MSDELIKMDWFDWEKEYIPRPGGMVYNDGDAEAAKTSHMYETYDEDIEVVLKVANSEDGKNCVWTMIDSDMTEEGVVIVPGYHLVNRIGYFLTEKPFKDEDLYRLYVD